MVSKKMITLFRLMPELVQVPGKYSLKFFLLRSHVFYIPFFGYFNIITGVLLEFRYKKASHYYPPYDRLDYAGLRDAGPSTNN